MAVENLDRIAAGMSELRASNRFRGILNVISVSLNVVLVIAVAVLASVVFDLRGLVADGQSNGERTNCRSDRYDPYYASQGQAIYDLLAASPTIREAAGLQPRTAEQVLADGRAFTRNLMRIQPGALERACGRAK